MYILIYVDETGFNWLHLIDDCNRFCHNILIMHNLNNCMLSYRMKVNTCNLVLVVTVGL